MTAYYNDNDPSAAEWLRELIKAGVIPDGDVDERSILDVEASDLIGYTQCHFFAGIAGWPLALRLAGWPDSRPVWTGSPPCQPFSPAGEGKGRDDERHLAPKFAGLVRAGRPEVLFGEQVASAAVFGKVAKSSRKRIAAAPDWTWLDDLSDRLEAARYAVGASDIPSAGIGAPHIRQRTFFGAYDLELAASRLADGECEQWQRGWSSEALHEPGTQQRTERLCDVIGVGDAGRARSETRISEPSQRQEGLPEIFDDGSDRLPRSDEGRPRSSRVADRNGDGRDQTRQRVAQTGHDGLVRNSTFVGLADSHSKRAERRFEHRSETEGFSQEECKPEYGPPLLERGGARGNRRGILRGDGVSYNINRPCPTNGFWGDADWLFCRDGKWRPVEPGTFPLAHGVSGRVGLLRGYGNAINPWAAKEFIEAFENARNECLRLDRVSVLAADKSGVFG